MYFVYMLRCRGGSLYTGIAADMEKRLRQHASGGAASPAASIRFFAGGSVLRNASSRAAAA